jgi:predicted metal-dependent peptidase
MSKPDLLQRSLARLILQHPFLATLALRLKRIADPAAPTAWTDGVHLAVNPTWFASLSDDERVCLVAHECYHVALAHHLRRRGRSPELWNRACDYAVNALLVADRFTLPPDALYDPAFGDATAEAIYHHLRQPEPQDSSADKGSAGSSSPGAGAAGGPLAADPQPAPSSPTETASFGEVKDQPTPLSPTASELDAQLAEHAVLITALAQQARAAGHQSAGAARAAARAAQPASVDWRGLLAEFLSSSTAQDFSWRRPNARYALLGFYIPSLEAAAPDNVAFVVDTSGSVSAVALEAVTSELEAYLLHYPSTTLRVLYADAAFQGSASFTAADLPLRLDPIGGGGTDFAPVLELLENDEQPPACVVYLTDLCGGFPAQPPSFPVLWLVFGQPLETPEAPFGKVVALPY